MGVHRITGSEVRSRGQMLPGYAAMRLGRGRPRHWRWRHTTLLAGLVAVGVTIAGIQGLLP